MLTMILIQLSIKPCFKEWMILKNLNNKLIFLLKNKNNNNKNNNHSKNNLYKHNNKKEFNLIKLNNKKAVYIQLFSQNNNIRSVVK